MSDNPESESYIEHSVILAHSESYNQYTHQKVKIDKKDSAHHSLDKEDKKSDQRMPLQRFHPFDSSFLHSRQEIDILGSG